MSAPANGNGISPEDAQNDPDAFPTAAQIPLKDFSIPDFPPQASRLKELTLTADIKLDEYQALVQDRPVTQPSLPELPASITNLTLELFTLGFPGSPPFLGRLARCLPNIRSLTLFSCLIDGLDDLSRKDAEGFFEKLTGLREVHFIDTFARPGFFKKLGEMFEKRGGDGVQIVDVSYTFRGHEDSDFLARVQGEELAGLINPGVVAANFDFLPIPVELTQDLAQEGEKSELPEGVLPFASDGRAPAAVKKRFEKLSSGALRSLKYLNLGMWSVRPVEVGEIVYACAGGGEPQLASLTVSVLLEDGWAQELVKGMEYKGVGGALENIELVGVPNTKTKGEGDDWKKGIEVVGLEHVEELAKACPKLARVKMSILQVKNAPNVEYMKEKGEWKKA
ncbi:hypothetical protein EDD36DRAFT_431132 [Exophiala viscosa]|uniref:Uncharacterized protein n=1 Tax=Exophiala viscosa TaxID=2486360 RepID=A0AAN6E3Q1_9EURO|nr:hypothetical protein EDD36DRAFT_431132 [Exophiala viscosa]